MNFTCRLKTKRGTDYGYLSLLVYHNKIQKEISLGRKIKLSDWDEKNSVPKSDQYKMLNIQIRNLKRDIANLIDEYEARKEAVDLEKIINQVYSNKSEKVETTDLSKQLLIDYIKDFIEKNPENLKLGTIGNYNSLVYALQEFNKKLQVSELAPEVVNNFYRFLKELKYKDATIETRMSKLRKIANCALVQGLLKEYPFGKGKHSIKRTAATGRRFLNNEEIEILTNYTPQNNSECKVMAIVKFNLHCGLRIGDLLTLRVNNFQIEEKQDAQTKYRLNKLTSKSNNPVLIPLSNQAKEAVLPYLENKEMSDYVFPFLNIRDYTEKQLHVAISNSTAYINKVLNRICVKLDLKHISTHTLRHTLATTLINKNVPLYTVSKVLAHKNINTTQIYAQLLQTTIDNELSVLNEK